MHSSSKLLALVSCAAIALGGCAANPSVGRATSRGGSAASFSGASPTHGTTSDYKPAALPEASSDGRTFASASGPIRGAQREGVGGR